MRAQNDGLRKHRQQAIRRSCRILLAHHAVEEHDELIAAVAAHVSLGRLRKGRPGNVVRTQAMRESLRDDAQEVVANRVSERVVDALKLIEIEEHEREGGTVAPCSFERLGELIVEARAVRELRDRVKVSKAMDLLDGPRALCGILDCSSETGNAAGSAQQCFAKYVHMAQFPVLSENAHVEPWQYITSCEPDEPADECPTVVFMNQILDHCRMGTELLRIHPENPGHLARADNAVARPLPFPAPDPCDPLRTGQLQRQVAVGGVFVLSNLARNLEFFLTVCDVALHVVEFELQAD